MKNKIVWITGASSGIGEALAKEIARRGGKLILSARRQTELERVKTVCVENGATPNDIAIIAFDMCDQKSLASCVERAYQAFGKVDLLINNAGISQRSFFQSTEIDAYRQLFEIDFFAQIALTKLVLEKMLTRGEGHIAITSSVAGKVGTSLRTGYCAAKHAVIGFYDALRAEVTHQGIYVSNIVPGFIRTNISNHALTGSGDTLGKITHEIASGMDADKAAKKIVDGLSKHKKEIYVGKGISMFALTLKRFAPNLLFRLVAKRGEKEFAEYEVK